MVQPHIHLQLPFSRKKAVIILAPSVAVASLVLAYAFNTSEQASSQVSDASSAEITRAELCADCDRPSTNPSTFMNEGGRSVILISFGSLPEGMPLEDIRTKTEEMEVSRGSTIRVILTIAHLASEDPLPTVELLPGGLGNHYIPPYAARSTTTEERVESMKAGKPIEGSVDLNTLITFSEDRISLKPNESKEIHMDISIPKDWPDEMVGVGVPFAVSMRPAQEYEPNDLLIKQTLLTVHIVE